MIAGRMLRCNGLRIEPCRMEPCRHTGFRGQIPAFRSLSVNAMKDRALKWLQLGSSLLLATVQRWLHDQAPALAAALAYYTAFAISPLIFLITLLAGFFYADPSELLSTQFGRLVPGSGAEALRQ